MSVASRRRVLLRHVATGLACLLAGLPAAIASPRQRDHDRAREAMERGEALPLAEILARVRPELGGEVVGVTFEGRHGHWIYEFRVITPGGQLREISVDAATARVLPRQVP